MQALASAAGAAAPTLPEHEPGAVRDIATVLGFNPFERPSLELCIERAGKLPIDQALGLMVYLIWHAQRNSYVAMKTAQRLECDALSRSTFCTLRPEPDNG